MSKMKLAVDFGNASTLLGLWDEVASKASMLEIPPYSHPYAMKGRDSDTHVAPSIIHYHNETDFLVGNQVYEHAARGGIVDPMTELKSRFINYKTKSGNRIVDNQTAATNFLSTILLAAKKSTNLPDDTEIVLTHPVNAFENYKVWLQDLSRACGFRHIRLLDEPVAAALTLIEDVDDDDVFLVFDYGAYTLDLALVRFSKKKNDRMCERLDADVLDNKAGDAIDLWLANYVLENHAQSFRDLDPQKLSALLRKECKFAKQRLSDHSKTTIEIAHPAGPKISINLTRTDLQAVLDSKRLINDIKKLVKKIFSSSSSVRMEDVRGVLLVGGSSYLPPIRAVLNELFGASKVFTQSPVQAVVHGATLYAGGAQIFDHIQNFYAFKYIDVHTQRFKPIVKPYSDYPYDGKEPVVVHAVKPKQSEFKLYIYEFNSDPSDIRISDDISHPPNSICLNQDTPVCIQVPHMVHKGDKAFEARFSINADKHLVMNVNAYDKAGNPTIKLIRDLVVVQLAKKQTVAIPRSLVDLVEDSLPDDEAPIVAEYPVNKIEQIPAMNEPEKADSPSPVVKKDKPKVSTPKTADKSKLATSLDYAPAPSRSALPSKTKTNDQILKEKLLPYRNSFESSLSTLAILFDKKHRDDSYKLTFLCDVLHKDARVINDGIYWKLKDVVETLHAANHSKRLDRNMARWVDVVVDSLDNWLVTWSKHCKQSGKLSNNSWLIPDSQVSKRLVTAGSLLDVKIETLSSLHGYDEESIKQQIVYLQNDDLLCVKLADEIKEARRYCWKLSKGEALKDREIQNSQWHLMVLPGIQNWLETLASQDSK